MVERYVKAKGTDALKMADDLVKELKRTNAAKRWGSLMVRDRLEDALGIKLWPGEKQKLERLAKEDLDEFIGELRRIYRQRS